MGRFVTGYGAQENGSDVTGLGVAGTMTGLQPIQQNFLPRNDISMLELLSSYLKSCHLNKFDLTPVQFRLNDVH